MNEYKNTMDNSEKRSKVYTNCCNAFFFSFLINSTFSEFFYN